MEDKLMPNYEDKIKKPTLTLDDYKLAVESAGQRYSDLAAKPFEYDINKVATKIENRKYTGKLIIKWNNVKAALKNGKLKRYAK